MLNENNKIEFEINFSYFIIIIFFFFWRTIQNWFDSFLLFSLLVFEKNYVFDI